MFKLMSITSGVILTVVAIYAAQKKAHDSLKDDEEFSDMTTGIRLVSGFATTVVVGGTINKIIQSVFK